MFRNAAAAGLATVAALFLTLACGGAGPQQQTATTSSAAPADDPATTGTISGRVRLDGTPPATRMIRLDGDPTCVQLNGSNQRPVESLAVSNGGVQHVFVYVKDGLNRSYPPPAQPVELDQQKCRYTPRVLGVQVGQPLVIRNSDALLHNVRAEPAINREFNLGQPIPMTSTRTFSTREVMVPFKCDVHAWMQAWVGVLDHPFFTVTDTGGAFTLPGIPAGSYTVEAWHETLGTQVQNVTVTATQSTPLEFAFSEARGK